MNHRLPVRSVALVAAVSIAALFAGCSSSSERQNVGGTDQGGMDRGGTDQGGMGQSDQGQGGMDQGGSSQAGGAKASSEAKTFLTKAAQANYAEIDLGDLALQKAQDPQVKQFAQRMIQDHTTLNRRTQQVASKLGVTLPSKTDETHQALASSLSKESGSQFDRSFMDHMVTDHQKVVNMFQEAARSSSDPEIKMLASEALPILQEHLKMGKEIQSRLQGRSGSPSGTSGSSTGTDMGPDGSDSGTSGSSGKSGSSDTGSSSGSSDSDSDMGGSE